MKTKALEILIVVFLFFVVGCKNESLQEKPEPNEPTMTESEFVPFPKDVSGGLLDFIPTWPEYIKLEKDLVITYDVDSWFREWPSGEKIMNTVMYEFPKGTKLYLKKDE